MPIPAYLIVHPKGLAVFDSGLNLATREAGDAYITPLGARSIAFDFAPGHEISQRLESLDVDPSQVRYIINSHLHYDHAGGNTLLPNAEVLVQRPEWEHASGLPDDDVAYRKVDFMTGQPLSLLDGGYDVFGDGSVTTIPTYGHTPGHQSLRVQTDRGAYILCGDACYTRHSLTDNLLPGIMHDAEVMQQGFAMLRRLEAAGATIMFGHDGEFWEGVPKAPKRLG